VEPIFKDTNDWFAEIDGIDAGPFMPEGRQQPATPPREIFRR
jgi:hypothetical protein